MSTRGEIPEARLAGVGEDRAYWWEFHRNFGLDTRFGIAATGSGKGVR
jgi:hypothetical protein